MQKNVINLKNNYFDNQPATLICQICETVETNCKILKIKKCKLHHEQYKT